jgi:hypothetical protein
LTRGLSIGKSPPPQGGVISADVIWEKNMKRQREKGGKCKKSNEGEQKGRKGK